MNNKLKKILRDVIEVEINGIKSISDNLENTLGENLLRSIDKIRSIEGNIIFCGLGKSGHIANKISATMTSTGTPSIFLHASEANHGDLGVIRKNDLLFIVSNSGETNELKNIINYAQNNQIEIISLTSNKKSFISSNSDISIVLPVYEEAYPNSLVPTTSTTMQLVIGDLIAAGLMRVNNFTEKDFKSLHPSGKIGASLLNISEVMHTGDSMPLANEMIKIDQAIIIMTQKRFGCLGLTDHKKNMRGIITDGDLRRSLSGNIFDQPAFKIMTNNPVTINKDSSINNAISTMNDKKITCLFVVDQNKPIGIVHLHDLIKISAL
ncbi:MAG: KpsF/GutQ family sugar-phosphate isomerase [Hyphomicrobiales bacterium]|nr:KpsF/GutQ family sugar-phosphate isomerase [Hyphomicrobiales bacterium]